MNSTNTNEIRTTGDHPVAIKSASPPLKRVLCLAMATLAGFAADAAAQDVMIPPTAASAQSYFAPDDRAPIHAIDGAGMTPSSPVTASSTTDNSYGGKTWLSNGNTDTWITFDMGSSQTLTGLRLWNYNEVNFPGRGVKTAGIYVGATMPPDGASYASMGPSWGTWVQNFTFSQATGSNGCPGVDYMFTAPVVGRYIQIYVTSNFGTNDSYTGISEIRFYKANVPEANILGFTLPDVPGSFCTIGSTSINLYVPAGTGVTSLGPEFTLSDGATCYNGDPGAGGSVITSGTVRNFTNPVHYWVRSMDDGVNPVVLKDYTVTVATAPTETTVIWNAGSGTWDTTSVNWLGQTSGLPALFSDGQNAIFNNAAGGTVTISSNTAPATTTVSATAGTYTFQGGPLSAGSLTKSGDGALKFSAANTFDGGVTLNAGYVGFKNGQTGAIGTGPLTINGGDIRVEDVSNPLVNNNTIFLNENFTASLDFGTGAVTLAKPLLISGSYTFGGPISGPGNLNAFDITYHVPGGWGGGWECKAPVTLRSDQTAQINGWGPMWSQLTISGAIDDGGNGFGLNVASSTGAARLRLARANTFSGDTTVGSPASGGYMGVCIGHNLALQNSALVVNRQYSASIGSGVTTPTIGGLKGSEPLASAFATAAFAWETSYYGNVTALTLNPGAGKTCTYTGAIADGAPGMAVVKTGDGTQELGGANTYTGNTTVNTGQLTLTETGSLTFKVIPSSSNKLTGPGTVVLNGGFVFDRSEVLAAPAAGSWTIVDATNVTYGATFSVSGFTKVGGVWTAPGWTFAPATGMLTFAPAALITDFRWTPAGGLPRVGVINQDARTITLSVPFGTALATVKPTFTVSSGTCNQTSGSAPSPTFAVANPAPYTVTDGSTINPYVVTVTVNPAAPGSVDTGLVLWLDASDASTMTLSGTTVNEWRDKYGGTGKMTLRAGTPTPVASGIGEMPTVRFSSASWMNDGVNHSAPCTIFYVSRQTGGSNARVLGASGNNWLMGYHGGQRDRFYFEGWVKEAGVSSDTNPHLYVATIDGAGQPSTVWGDGTLLASNTGGTQGPNNLELNGYSSGGELSDCDISELVVYNRVLSTEERNAVTSYLNTKYSLTPPPTWNWVKTTPTGTYDWESAHWDAPGYPTGKGAVARCFTQAGANVWNVTSPTITLASLALGGDGGAVHTLRGPTSTLIFDNGTKHASLSRGTDISTTTPAAISVGAITLNSILDINITSHLTSQVTINSPIGGTGGLNVISATGNYPAEGWSGLILNSANTYTGDTVISSAGWVIVNETTGSLRFKVTDTGSNKITGAGTIRLNGSLVIDTSEVTLTNSSDPSWTLVDVATLKEYYGANFNVPGFTKSGNYWMRVDGSRIWVFDTTTGILSLPAGWITDFRWGIYVGVINQVAKTIALTVPSLTDLATLNPTFALSSGSCDQTSGSPPSDNFAVANPATYTVTDGSTVNPYVVTVTVAALGTGMEMTKLYFPGYGYAWATSATSFLMVVPKTTDLNGLTPTYIIPWAATGSPRSGTAMNFNTPQPYLITAEDGSSTSYTVTVQQATTGGTGGYQQRVLASGPVAYWPLNETSGPTAFDVAGGTNNMTYGGTYTLNRTELRADGNPSVLFSNATTISYTGAPYDSSLNPKYAFTAECWVKPIDSAVQYLVSLQDRSSGRRAYAIWRNNNSTAFGMQWGTSGANTDFMNGATSIVPDTVYHVVGTYDGSKMRLYVNGVLDASKDAPLYEPATINQPGFSVASRNGNAPAACNMQDVALYSRALTAQEIQTHYLNPPPTLTYANWAATKYPTADLSDPAADLDGDGRSNFTEYAFGLNPTSGASCNPISTPLDKGTHKFRYTRTENTGLAYTVWTSTNLQSWAGPAAATQTVLTTSDGVETVEVSLTSPPSGGTLFVRVKAQ